jgi:hypothetical protein
VLFTVLSIGCALAPGIGALIGAGALGATFIALFVVTPFVLTRQAHLSAWQVGRNRQRLDLYAGRRLQLDRRGAWY